MKLMEQVCQVLRVRHYSLATERCYCQWIRRFIFFHGVKHPNSMGAEEVERFLTHLATAEKVAASTQNQALNALVFLYRDVLRMDLGNFDAVRARRPLRVPTVLSQAEAGKDGRMAGTTPFGPVRFVFIQVGEAIRRLAAFPRAPKKRNTLIGPHPGPTATRNWNGDARDPITMTLSPGKRRR